MQTANNSASTNIANNNISISQRHPRVPPKKPLVSAQEMERLREVAFKDRINNSLNDFSIQEEEQLDSTVEQLDSLLQDGFVYF